MIMNIMFNVTSPGSVLIKSMILLQIRSPSRVRIIWFLKRIFSISSNVIAIFVILVCGSSLLPETRRVLNSYKLINLTDFQFVINNNICSNKNISLLTMVNSALQNRVIINRKKTLLKIKF